MSCPEILLQKEKIMSTFESPFPSRMRFSSDVTKRLSNDSDFWDIEKSTCMPGTEKYFSYAAIGLLHKYNIARLRIIPLFICHLSVKKIDQVFSRGNIYS